MTRDSLERVPFCRYAYVTDLARRLQLYRPEHVLSAGHLHDELDVPTFAAYLNFLVPENMLVFLTAKENEGKANRTVRHQDSGTLRHDFKSPMAWLPVIATHGRPSSHLLDCGFFV